MIDQAVLDRHPMPWTVCKDFSRVYFRWNVLDANEKVVCSLPDQNTGEPIAQAICDFANAFSAQVKHRLGTTLTLKGWFANAELERCLELHKAGFCKEPCVDPATAILEAAAFLEGRK